MIIGTAAVRDPALVKDAARGLSRADRRRPRCARRQGGGAGLAGEHPIFRALDVARRFEDAGVSAIIYTDIDRDGALAGFNVDATVASPMRCRSR